MAWEWHRVIDPETVDADSVWLVKDAATGVVHAEGKHAASSAVYDGYTHLLKH
jgi:hypothetical protein